MLYLRRLVWFIASRLILIVLMFLGRVGGLTLIYAAQSVKKGTQSTLLALQASFD